MQLPTRGHHQTTMPVRVERWCVDGAIGLLRRIRTRLRSEEPSLARAAPRRPTVDSGEVTSVTGLHAPRGVARERGDRERTVWTRQHLDPR